MSERNFKIQSKLPLRTVGIETQRERNHYTYLPPQNYIHVWWARRPTPATRLAILGSVLPEDIDNDTLLRWMGINPSNKPPEDSISEHVRKKKETVDDRDGMIYDHYGYRKIWTQEVPDGDLEDIHNTVKEHWGGELPTVLDATAGGGSIPFESVRYGFPTVANELNPVASVILKAVLEHPRADGDLTQDIQKWGEKINRLAAENLDQYFPDRNGRLEPVNYIWANTITCPDCGLELPLVPSWWIHKESSSEGTAVRPEVTEDGVTYDVVELPDDVTKSEFNPTDGTVSYGKGNCLRCDVTIGGDEIKDQAQSEEMGDELYCVEYRDTRQDERGKFRIPTSEDREAATNAQETVNNDPDLATLLSEERYIGLADRSANYGITKWRDMYSDRQLLTHYEYLRSFNEIRGEVYEEYDDAVAEAILTFLTLIADKALDYNNRLCSWDSSRPKVRNTFERHDFSFKWTYAESNLTAEGLGYEWILGNVLQGYEDLHDLSGESNAPVKVLQGDAADLDIENEDIEAIVLDPPYYDNVMYAELSDFFYVWMKKYLGDIYPGFFNDDLTDKNREAVANPAEFENVAGEGESKRQLAKDSYERKMTNIFDEMHRVLDKEGIFTLMFTHKKTEAWDTLTKALIEAGFVVTSTHPVSTESSHSLHQSGKNSAESTILLSSVKREKESEGYTLWSDIQQRTRKVARERALELDQGDVDFAKVDVILASFGPALQTFTEEYPVVDDTGEEIAPQTALDEARSAVRDYFIDKYLNEGVRNVDPKTEWYIISWLVFEAQRFPYDEGRRLAIGVGEDLDSLKKDQRMWRKKSGDVLLRPHKDRVKNVNKKPEDRSSRIPVDPDSLSFATALDKVHAAMHIYDAKGATEAWNWMNDRNCGSDPAFKATLEALLRVLPQDHADWQLARDMAAGETGDLLGLELDADIFQEEKEKEKAQQGNLTDF